MKIEATPHELAQFLADVSKQDSHDPYDNAASLATERLTEVVRLVLREERKSARYLRRIARDLGQSAVMEDAVELDLEDDDDDEDLTEPERVHEDEWN